MEITGKVFKVMPVESGEGKKGPWKKQQIVLELENGKYTKKVALEIWNELIDNNNFQESDTVSLEYDIESREYQGKWYTGAKAWRVNKVTENPNKPVSQSEYEAKVNEKVVSSNGLTQEPLIGEIDDDLPF
mgnify:FL=1